MSRNGEMAKSWQKSSTFGNEFFLWKKQIFRQTTIRYLKIHVQSNTKNSYMGNQKKKFVFVATPMVPTIISFAYCRHPIPTFQGPERPRLKLCLKTSLRYAESKWIGSRLGNPRTFSIFYLKSDWLISLSLRKKGYVHYYAALYHIRSEHF